jgi:arginine N-succinyltransferase
LPEAAQKVIGLTHEESTGARRILESEGMTYTGKIDVFDGGPCLDAAKKDIRAIAESKTAKIEFAGPKDCHGRFLVANPSLANFRAVQGPAAEGKKGKLGVTREAAKALGVREGDLVRYVELISRKNKNHASG